LNHQFEIYLHELLEWNKKFNLTSITDPAEIRIKHFEDSLTLLQAVELSDQSVIDIGAGAGFPGIPLKLARPGIKLTLVEATRKKTDFLKQLVSVLELKETEVLWGRAEELVKDRRESYDIAVSRAVAKLNILSKWCLPFVKPGGLFIAYKGDEVEAEVKEAEGVIKKQGGIVKEIKKVQLPGSEIIHSLVLIAKT
jgi:16S rRNA (guanine527-N7)-methyltransferase